MRRLALAVTAALSLAAAAAVAQGGATFEPARIGGQAVRSCVELPVDYRLR